jgi:hypothetical protein
VFEILLTGVAKVEDATNERNDADRLVRGPIGRPQHLNGPQVESVNIENAKSKFKEIWPQVEQGLDLLKQLAGVVPGVGPFVAIGAGAVVAAGDAAYKALGGGT